MEQNEKETIGVKNEENVESTPQTTQKSHEETAKKLKKQRTCLLYTSPSPRDRTRSRMPSSA